MSGKDINILTGTMYDKLCISLGKPVSIMARADLNSTIDKLAELKRAGIASGDETPSANRVVNIEDGT